jgi:hypothetical protein
VSLSGVIFSTQWGNLQAKIKNEWTLINEKVNDGAAGHYLRNMENKLLAVNSCSTFWSFVHMYDHYLKVATSWLIVALMVNNKLNYTVYFNNVMIKKNKIFFLIEDFGCNDITVFGHNFSTLHDYKSVSKRSHRSAIRG